MLRVSATGMQNRTRARTGLRTPGDALSLAALLLCLVPLAFVLLPCVSLILKVETADVLAALSKPSVVEAMVLSLTTSATATVVSIVIGTPAAYYLARGEVRGRRIIDAILNLPLVLPPVVAGVALLMAFGRRGLLGETLSGWGVNITFTTIAVVIAQTFMGLPLYIQGARTGFQSVPRSLLDAARTLGLSDLKTFFKVTVPLSWPALVSGAILCWGRAVGEFGATIMFAGNMEGKTRTMPLAILTAMQADVDSALVLAVLLLSFSCGIFVLARWVLGGKERGS